MVIDASELLKNHQELQDELSRIPEERPIQYREEVIDGNLIGKPRFVSRYYQWDQQSLTKIHNHLADIWYYFNLHSYWFDDDLKEILLYKTRKLSKKSVIFLLEHDVWETSEVYGDYLIEEFENSLELSYFSFDHRFKTFNLPKYEYEEREKWICANAREQIQNQFLMIWNRIEIEIVTCQEESYHPEAIIELTDMELRAQILHCQDLAAKFPKAALLLLGYIEEMWLLKAMNRTHLNRYEKIMVLAKTKKVIPTSKLPLFIRIRNDCNKLKHRTQYDIKNCELAELIDEFIPLISRTNS